MCWDRCFYGIARHGTADDEDAFILERIPLGGQPVQELNCWGHIGGMASGADGSLWFTERHSTMSQSYVGKISATDALTVHAWPDALGSPGMITASTDGTFWVAADNAIARVTVQGTVTGFHTSHTPYDLVSGMDGSAWFLEHGLVGRVYRSGVLHEYPIPSTPPGAADLASDLTAASDLYARPDGTIWFTDHARHRLARVSGAGVITEVALPASGPSR